MGCKSHLYRKQFTNNQIKIAQRFSKNLYRKGLEEVVTGGVWKVVVHDPYASPFSADRSLFKIKCTTLQT
jgi:hypothetical protein